MVNHTRKEVMTRGSLELLEEREVNSSKYTVHLPIVTRNYSHQPKLGIDARMPNALLSQQLKSLGTAYSTPGNIRWDLLEYEGWDPEVNGPLLTAYEKVVDNYLGNDIIPLLPVHGTPNWALKPGSIAATQKVEEFGIFFERLVKKLPQVTEWQLFNEVDEALGVAGIFGGWGPPALRDYVNILEEVDYLRSSNLKISTSLMLPPNSTWHQDFVKLFRGTKYIDHINFHYYAHWWPNYDFEDLQRDILKLKQTIHSLHDLFGIPIWLTETNLLVDGAPTADYEMMKCQWLQAAVETAFAKEIEVVIVYSWYSGWKNANVRSTPAEQTYKQLCRRYNP